MLSSRSKSGILTDYTTLVKTRLADLSITTLQENEAAADRLVQQAVEEFHSHGRILSKVTEISIFSSPFYIGCFLPSLLSTSCKEDSTRQALIEELLK